MKRSHQAVWAIATLTALLLLYGVGFSTDALLLAMLVIATGIVLLGMHFDAKDAERRRGGRPTNAGGAPR
ncbi:hypothetical protein L0U85_05465 [Glycomyces sp. L485]|uniref:hypothetical protein n=1 Tax=Glycomyces sp. L485 TaxID=2909235 RepID=UPI001F4B50A6|nr:hypothetical protein [Glycomyces sp. L485]MCH7230306.1 hypothetical protein [Glycomyces sp. L485]